MHIPDGFLDVKTCLGTYCLAAAGLGWAAREVSARWTDRTVPMLGVMSAFVFAGQMVNFPVAGGTSGHLLGAALAAALLGPAAATMALTTVLAVQCLFFQDGGLTALGANALNLALVGVLGGYWTYRLLRKVVAGPRGLVLSAAVAGWVSVVLAAAACAFELGFSGTAPMRLAMPAMVLTHAIIGIGEALITAAVISFVLKVRPDLVYDPGAVSTPPPNWREVVGYGLAFALGIGILLAPMASKLPDGLEALSAWLGFEGRARPGHGPLADYTVPGLEVPWLATPLAAVLGTLVCFGVALGLAWLLARSWRRRRLPRPGD